MKKKTNIKTLIRKIVREEVAMAINEVITELKQPTQQVSQPQPKKKIVEKKKPIKKTYTSNKVLNDILNETANDDSGWETLGGDGKIHTTQDASSLLKNKYANMMSGDTGVNVAQMAVESNVNPEAVPEHVTDALTKDYSALMKAIDKKKGK